MKITHSIGVAAFVCLLGSPHSAAADAVSSCGEAQAKVSAKFIKAILFEGTRACTAGSAQAPAAVDVAKLQAALDKALAGIQNAVAKFGAPNCYPNPINTEIATVITIVENYADRLCRVPSG
jgi:hypothetical protein